MNRRHFCKISMMALGAAGLSKVDSFAATTQKISDGENITAPSTCAITVIRRECYEDMQSLYLDDPIEGPCRAYQTGDEFNITAGDACPRDFCPKAWRVVCQALKENGGCAATTSPGLILASCPDGTRPVIFKIQRV